MLITRINLFSGKENTLDLPITREQIEAWMGGQLIQNAMSNLSADEREFLISGATPEEWEKMFGGE